MTAAQVGDEGGRVYEIKRQHADVGGARIYRVVCGHSSCRRAVGRSGLDGDAALHLLINHATVVHGSDRAEVKAQIAAASRCTCFAGGWAGTEPQEAESDPDCPVHGAAGESGGSAS